jgi:hypothetical protein
MATMCIQCAMRAMLKDEQVPLFDETPEEHRQRFHPDLEAATVERRDLELRLAEKLRDGT